MPFIPDDFGQVTHVFNIPGPGGPAMVTYGIEDNPIQTADAIAGFAQEAWIDVGSMISLQDGQTVLVETRVLLRRAGELLSGISTSNVTGGVSGTNAPPQVAVLFQKRTGFAGRNRRGRLYLPGAPASFEDGTYAPATVALFNASAAILLADLSSANIAMHLLHVSSVDTPNPVTELIGQGLVATQRRRVR